MRIISNRVKIISMTMNMFFGASPSTFEKAKELRNNMTLAEKILWERLSNKQIHGFKFRRQHPIATFIADFYCHSAKLIIEVDGEIHNAQKDYDAGRAFELGELGIKVIRFRNEEIINEIDKVIEKIIRNLSSNLE
jgi:very-short-patch-repair endonuclease